MITPPDLATRIAAAKELYAKATPGEYTFRRQWNEGNCPTLTVGDVDEFGDYSAVTEDSFRSAAYIHNLFPNLVANWDRKGQRIAALEAENARLARELEEAKGNSPAVTKAMGCFHQKLLEVKSKRIDTLEAELIDKDATAQAAIREVERLEADNDWLRQRVADLEEGIRDYIEREKAFGERR